MSGWVQSSSACHVRPSVIFWLHRGHLVWFCVGSVAPW